MDCLTDQCTTLSGAGPGDSTCSAAVGNDQTCIGDTYPDYQQALQELGQS